MQVTVNNQVPGYISPLYMPNIKNDFDILKEIEEGLVEALLQPIDPAIPVEVLENGQTITKDVIATAVAATFDDNINVDAEETCKTLFEKTMLYPNYVNSTSIGQLFPTQAAAKLKLPLPSLQAHYMTQTDVIPTCKLFLAGKACEDALLANFAFTYSPKTLGVFFLTESHFNDFKQYVATQNATLGSIFPQSTSSKLNDFCSLKLDGLTEGLDLRAAPGDDNDPYSFSRTIVWLLMHYIQQNVPQGQTNKKVGLLPFDLSELYIPKSILFINIDKHAHSNLKDIDDEWKIILKALAIPFKIISKKQITKLGSTVRQYQKLQGQAANFNLRDKMAKRLLNQKFSSKRPPVTTFIKHIKRKVEKMASVNHSQNTYKKPTASYLKPNRRDPMNTNLMGKTTNENYRPDIHLYVDTSGSISEKQYQDSVKAAIGLAKTMDVNIYINTFSDLISTSTKLRVKWRSVKAVYKDFQRIPKVTGGTDFANVWQYIQKSPIRRRELSIMITDFEYRAPNRPDIEHPKNLYYTACSQIDWGWICNEAKKFVESTKHIEPAIRTRILF